MPGISRVPTPNQATGFAPVRLFEGRRRQLPCLARPAARPRGAVPVIELALHNGRVLRVAETIAPETLARLAAALDR